MNFSRLTGVIFTRNSLTELSFENKLKRFLSEYSFMIFTTSLSSGVRVPKVSLPGKGERHSDNLKYFLFGSF